MRIKSHRPIAGAVALLLASSLLAMAGGASAEEADEGEISPGQIPTTTPDDPSSRQEDGVSFIDAGASGMPTTLPNGEPYDHLAARTVRAASNYYNEVSEMAGFGEVAVSDDEHSAIVSWKGALPSSARTAANDAFAGLTWSYRAVDYTEAELEAAALRASQPRDARAGQQASPGATAYPNDTNSGIIVETVATSDLAELEDDQVAEYVDVDVPVELLVVEGDALVTDLNRYADRGSLTGATRIGVETNGIPDQCSAGFTIHDQKRNESAMLTAAHCVDRTGRFVTNDGNYRGVTTRFSRTPDIATFARYRSGYENAIYVGTAQASGVRKVAQGLILAPTRGMKGCMSGASSGTLCGARVYATKGYSKGKGPFVKVRRGAHGGAAGGGDSGGPFFKYVYSDIYKNLQARAIGIVSKGIGAQRTGDNCAEFANRCYARVGMTNLNAIKRSFNFFVPQS